MYLSTLLIKNYRSIKELSLTFQKGKNIIVGKNNSGKSNILKAIDLVLGEASPAYHKSENITENDFFNGNVDEPIFIFCELVREEGELLDYNEIYKCYGYKIHTKIIKWEKVNGKNVPTKENIRHKIPNDTLVNFFGTLDALMNISEDDDGIDTVYINPKLRHQKTFEAELEDKFQFAFAFRAFKNAQNKIQKEIRFFYRESPDSDWLMCFSAPIRNEFLQSAVIHSFRDPLNELRINQWTWFGKLLKAYIDTDDPHLRTAFDQLKIASNGVFNSLQTEINDSKIKVAFPDTLISFQFNPDTKLDVYKSALIYVDDGFNSLLQDKGSGIQSAVIIGLFHYYTNKIAHSSSSLLAIEEPEIYLHQQARKVISSRIDDFLQGNKNQVIITTHSTEFITSAHENLNIIVTKKDRTNGTHAKNTKFDSPKEKQILVKTQNSEMFFADKVILVEGGDKYIVESLAKFFGKNVVEELSENWLDEQNISVIAVGGKSEFWKYRRKLNELSIPSFILADFDFFLRELAEFFTALDAPQKIKDELNGIKGKAGVPQFELSRKIFEHIETFETAIEGEGLKVDRSALKKYLKEPFRLKKLSQLETAKIESVRKYLARLRKSRIYILENELEDYYTSLCKSLTSGNFGKEEKAIFITSRLVTPEKPIVAFVNPDEFFDFFSFVIP